MALSITTSTTDAGVVVAAQGEVDVSCASELREALDAVLGIEELPSALTVDLSEVPYIDSTGIGVLVGAAHRAAERGVSFAVAHPQRNVKRVFDLLGVARELGIASTEV